MNIITFNGFKILLFLLCIAQYDALFGPRGSSEIRHIRVHLEDDGRPMATKYAAVKLLHLVPGEKFYPLSASNKKRPLRPKHVKQYAVGKLMSSSKADAEKSCCGQKDEWKDNGVSLGELFRPVSLTVLAPGFNSGPVAAQIHRDPQFDDVKPVTEHIEDDLKYDFRTKTHSV